MCCALIVHRGSFLDRLFYRKVVNPHKNENLIQEDSIFLQFESSNQLSCLQYQIEVERNRITTIVSFRKELEVDQITQLINKYVNMSISMTPWLDVFAPGAIMIRPTGNPIGQKLWEEMQASEDVGALSSELLNIDKIDVFEGTSVSTGMACVIFTDHSKFTYKGTPNGDVAVHIIVAKKSDDQWKIVHTQRSTGRKPDEPKPDFSNL